jgi:hypothetical protein
VKGGETRLLDSSRYYFHGLIFGAGFKSGALRGMLAGELQTRRDTAAMMLLSFEAIRSTP